MFHLRSLLISLTAFLLFAQEPAAAASGYVTYYGDTIGAQPMGENLCAITFDDGPGPFTPHLLDMLDEYGIKATFFMLGKNAQKHPEIVRRALAEGHEVESHSYSHPNMKHLGAKARETEIVRTNEILRSLGAEPRFMRPPYGAKDEALAVLAAQHGISLVTWTRDSLDWKRLPDDYTLLPDNHGRVSPSGHLRGIFLFHDIHRTTVEDLPRIVSQLRAGGCQRFVTVEEYVDGFFLDPEPPMLMTRRPTTAPAASVRTSSAPAAGTPVRTTGNGAVPASPGETAVVPAAFIPDSSEPPFTWTPAVSAWKGLAVAEAGILPRPQKKSQGLFEWLGLGRSSARPAPARTRSGSFFRVGERMSNADASDSAIHIEPVLPSPEGSRP
ncbi:MAG: polysaccharide deacetylase family protein [Desulfovibrionaceae bacterium]|nr:polysaccharide deacetylase family protein [Desulfovibrionaceae bacterium]